MSGRLGPRFGVRFWTPKRGPFVGKFFAAGRKIVQVSIVSAGTRQKFRIPLCHWVPMVLQRREQLFSTPCERLCPHMFLNCSRTCVANCSQGVENPWKSSGMENFWRVRQSKTAFLARLPFWGRNNGPLIQNLILHACPWIRRWPAGRKIVQVSIVSAGDRSFSPLGSHGFAAPRAIVLHALRSLCPHMFLNCPTLACKTMEKPTWQSTAFFGR